MRFRLRTLLLFVFLVALVLASGVAVRRRAYQGQFMAQGRLQILAEPPTLMPVRHASDEVGRQLAPFQRTQLVLVESQLVLNAALLHKNVVGFRTIRTQTNPIAWLQEHIKAEFVDGSEVMEISLRGDNPMEIAGIVNAVKKSYMDQVVNVDTKRRADRHTKLKAIKANYVEILKERRERLRKLQEAIGGDNFSASVMLETLASQHASLKAQRVQIVGERSEAEAVLARRKMSAGAANEQARNETTQLEDKIAALTARQKVIDEELENIARERKAIHTRVLDVSALEEEVAQLMGTFRKVADEVEALAIELQAPPRVRTIEDAVPPTRRQPWGVSSLIGRP
jgi:hypothetical protein